MSKRGFAPPNHTQTPNEFYDSIMLEIDSLAEMKVTCAIIRKTFGWHVKERELSLADLEDLTGLTRTSVSDGIKRAMGRGTVSRRKVGNSYAYKLVVEEVDQSKPSTIDSIDAIPSASPESIPETVQHLDHFEPIIKEKKEKTDKEKQQQTTVVVDIEDKQAIKSWTRRIPTINEKVWHVWLGKHPRDWIEERVKWFEWQKQQEPRTRTGWLVTAIREEWPSAPDGYEAQKPPPPTEYYKSLARKLATDEGVEEVKRTLGLVPALPPKPGQLDPKHADGVAVTAGLRQRKGAA